MTTLEALNWLAMMAESKRAEWHLCPIGYRRYRLRIRESGYWHEIEREGPFGEALPALVLGIRRLMEVKQ